MVIGKNDWNSIMSKVFEALGEVSSGDLDSLHYELHSTQQKYEAAMERIALLEKTIADAAAEMHCTVNDLYPHRHAYPSEMRLWKRDMELVDHMHSVLDNK